ncbi:MAG: protein kinase, partial [Armatimonadota bacterium]|nr:protein kinase [Armatimonadota bacterium]
MDSPVGVVNCLACGSPNYQNRERCWKCLAPIAGSPTSSAAASPPPKGTSSAQVLETSTRAVPAAAKHAPDIPVGVQQPVGPGIQPSEAPPPPPRQPRKPKVDPALQQRLEEEVASLSDAIENGRGDADTFELRASYLVELNRLDEAEADIEKAPEGARKEILLGDIAAARGQLREASDIYEGVLAADPTRSGVARKLARLYVQQKSFNPDEAEFVRDTLEKQIDRIAGGPDWVGWISFLHERYAAAERWDEELSLLRAAVVRSPLPSNPRLGLWLVDALLATGAIHEAQENLPQLPLAAGHPAAAIAYRNTARALIRNGQNEAARELYRLLSASPVAGDAAERLAMLEKATDGQRFVPLEKVGAGAVAEVWKAFDLYSGDYAGLKILHESLSGDAAAHEELRREFELMSSSLSPRIARAVPGTLQEDRFAMELLDYSLVALLEQPASANGLPLRQAVDIAQQIAEGVEYLHVRGLVYQDLSPQNILFKGTAVKLCDLGGVKEGVGTAADATVAKVAYA